MRALILVTLLAGAGCGGGTNCVTECGMTIIDPYFGACHGHHKQMNKLELMTLGAYDRHTVWPAEQLCPKLDGWTVETANVPLRGITEAGSVTPVGGLAECKTKWIRVHGSLTPWSSFAHELGHVADDCKIRPYGGVSHHLGWKEEGFEAAIEQVATDGKTQW